MATLAPAIALGATVGLASAPASAAVWNSCDQWGNTTSTATRSTTTSGAPARAASASGPTPAPTGASGPTTRTPAASSRTRTPRRSINKSITSLGSLTSNYNVTVPSSGAYNTSYDIWDTDYRLRDHALGQQQRSRRPARLLAGQRHARRPLLGRLQGQQRGQPGLLVPPHLQLHLRHGEHPADPEVDQGHQGLVAATRPSATSSSATRSPRPPAD